MFAEKHHYAMILWQTYNKYYNVLLVYVSLLCVPMCFIAFRTIAAGMVTDEAADEEEMETEDDSQNPDGPVDKIVGSKLFIKYFTELVRRRPIWIVVDWKMGLFWYKDLWMFLDFLNVEYMFQFHRVTV